MIKSLYQIKNRNSKMEISGPEYNNDFRVQKLEKLNDNR